eukprot:TRINITY_DN7085_c0_g1_i1.p1 TRINITY_DN7085_c0_g1~~TRINITY_DN7085_c0_g1_i1.p1  ORF type:complete len:228 (-),score=46.16 TRINITY_DN7085_c0_g1_i1:2-685(-)
MAQHREFFATQLEALAEPTPLGTSSVIPRATLVQADRRLRERLQQAYSRNNDEMRELAQRIEAYQQGQLARAAETAAMRDVRPHIKTADLPETWWQERAPKLSAEYSSTRSAVLQLETALATATLQVGVIQNMLAQTRLISVSSLMANSGVKSSALAEELATTRTLVAELLGLMNRNKHAAAVLVQEKKRKQPVDMLSALRGHLTQRAEFQPDEDGPPTQRIRETQE